MTDQLTYGVAVIKEILPHRSPFLFVDRVLKINCGENIFAEKDLSPDEWFFSGHFPGNPIVPGVIVSEALAQTSGLLLGLTFKTQDREQAGFSLANLTIKFVTPARPKETIRLAATLKKTYGKMFLFEVTADVLNRRIAKGTLILASD